MEVHKSLGKPSVSAFTKVPDLVGHLANLDPTFHSRRISLLRAKTTLVLLGRFHRSLD
jgi:hypothetical protein